MSAPRPRSAVIAALLALALGAFVLLRGDDTYTLKLAMQDAAGLRDGSPVSVGGVRVGEVELALGDDGKVHADLKVERGTRIPKDAQVGISAVNFLGQKQVAFTGGDPAVPAPDGYEIPAARVTTSTDLDQVLNTLDADTRTRLAILVNEAGAAVAGRSWEISRDLEELPTTLRTAHELLSELVQDNRTLKQLVTSSDRFIATTTAGRKDLVELVDTLGQTSRTVETKRARLRATLAKAPATLGTLQRFLGELQRTTVPLGPAARSISRTAPALQDTLGRVEGFRRAANPALDTATALAPGLTELGDEATPIVRQARPTLRSLARLAPAARPLTDALDRSANNLIGTVGNWAQAIQLRDGLGHIFRGEAAYSPDAVTSALDRLGKPASTPARRTQAIAPGAARRPTPATGAAGTPRPSVVTALTDTVEKTLGTVLGTAGRTTKDLTGRAGDAVGEVLGGRSAAPGGERPSSPLLDYLLRP